MTNPPDTSGMEDLLQVPVIAAVDVGSLPAAEDTEFAVLRIRWATAADFDEGTNDHLTVMILSSEEALDHLIDDLQAIRPQISVQTPTAPAPSEEDNQ